MKNKSTYFVSCKFLETIYNTSLCHGPFKTPTWTLTVHLKRYGMGYEKVDYISSRPTNPDIAVKKGTFLSLAVARVSCPGNR